MGWSLDGMLFYQRKVPLINILWLPMDGLAYDIALTICSEEITTMWQDKL